MAIVTEKLDLVPAFDMELFMMTSQETRIGGDLMERVEVLWGEWMAHRNAVTFNVGDTGYLLVWLGEEVENAVDEAWDSSPSDAYMINVLAQVMCMGMIHEALPQVMDVGCAPAPKGTEELANALEEIGVPYSADISQTLARRYAVLTYYPFKGGCEVCSLIHSCPKGGSSSNSFTIGGQ